VVFTLVIISILIPFGGCDRSANKSQVASGASVSGLLAKLPNLKPFGMESCKYTIGKSSARSTVPSPSDTRVDLKGSAKLSAEGLTAATSRFEWKLIPRDQVPRSLAAIVPTGELRYSVKLNEMFADNPTFAHGFVVRPASEGAREIFFLSTDIDHPIK
jgi:hypothetical protein